jgi:membrane protein DedA with SNARE-associated domain
MVMPTDSRTIPEVFTDALTQFVTLLRKESQLARAEVSEKMSSATAGLGFIVGGAVLLIPALVILLQALVAELSARGVMQPWPAVIVGGAALLLGLMLFFIGTSRLRPANMVPARTINQFQQDAAAAKNQMREGHDLNRAA